MVPEYVKPRLAVRSVVHAGQEVLIPSFVGSFFCGVN